MESRMQVYLKQFCFAFCSLFINVLFLSTPSYAATGVEWLSSIQNADGSYVTSTDVATATQSTAETLSTFKALQEQSQSGIPAALDFINSETYLNTENLARQIIANDELGNDVSILLDVLRLHQNIDGGFGEFSGYQSTAIDTAFAMKALAVSPQNASEAIDYAVSYILGQQNANGSFSLSDRNDSSVYITSVCVSSLQKFMFQFNISSELDNALNFIITSQASSGGWENELETVVALNAIIPLVTDKSSYLGSVDWLRSQQLSNGSWGHDAYITALAERAIYLADNITDPVSPTKGAITGHVVNQSTGEPIVGATISLMQDPFTTVQSDVNGAFNFINVPVNTYTLNYTALGFSGVTQTLTTQPGLLIDVGTVDLQPLADVGIIKGVVTSKADGSPVSGALISVSGAFTDSTTSNAEGSYEIAGAAGTVVITISATDYEPATASGQLNVSSTLIFSPALLNAGTIPTSSGVTITGVVIDGATNQVVQGANISVVSSSESTISGLDGVFELSGLQSGEVVISIVHADFLQQQLSLVASDGAVINLGSIRLYQEAPTVSSISGIVTDSITGAPVSGAEMRLVGTNNTVNTSLAGEYAFNDLSGSEFTVTASATGYFSSTGSITVAQPANVGLSFSLDRASSSDFDIVDMHIETGIYIYDAGAELETDIVMHNTGALDRSVRVFYKVINSVGVVLEEGPTVMVPLNADPSVAYVNVPSGAIIETEFEWYTLSHAPGDYQIIAQIYDVQSGQMLAERGMGITINPTTQIGGSVDFNPPITQLAANTSVEISAEIINTGNQIIEPATVTATLRLVKEGYKSRQDLVSIKDTLTDESFNQTQGMDIDADGNLYVANKLGGTISMVNTAGDASIFADNLTSPVDVDIDATGTVYILLQNSSFIVIDADGARTEVLTNVQNQSGIEAQENGDAYITSGNALYNVTLAGAVTKIVSGGIANPHDMVVAADGTVYIASSEDNSITQYKNGQLSTFVDGINQPYGLAIDSNEDLIVTSYGDNTLLRVTPQGDISVIATGLSGPFDVILDPAGNFVVSNSMSNEIVQIDQSGNLTVIGESSINKPHSVAYNSSGELYVGNSGSGNIVKYDQAGAFTEFANGLSNPTEILITDDGGLDVLESNGTIYHVSADGSKTKIVDGRRSATDFIKAPDGNGYIVVESSETLLARVDSSGQYSNYFEQMLKTVEVMTKADSGNIYAFGTGSTGNTVYKITPDYQVEILASGLNRSFGIAVDSSENVYLTQYSQKEILKIDNSGNITVAASTSFYPGAITVNKQDEIFLARYSGTIIYQLVEGGILNEVVTSTDKIVHGLVQDANENFWTSHQNASTVTKITSSGETSTFSGISLPGGVVLDGTGGVYVRAYRDIKHISDSGVVTTALSSTSFSNSYKPTFAIDADGNYLVPGSSAILYLFDSSSNLIKTYTSLKTPLEIMDNGNGEIYLVNGNGIVKIRGEGYMPEIIAFGYFKSIAKETATTAIVSSGGGPQRLNLITGELTGQMRYSSSTHSYIKSIAVNPLGGFVMGDYGNNRLVFYNNNDAEEDVQAGIVSPRGIMFDQSGKLLIANEIPNGLISLRDDRKAEIHLLDSGGFDYIQIKEDGNFYAASTSDGEIYEYDTSLRKISTISVPESGALAVASDGSLYATSPIQGSLISISTDGSNTYEQLATGLSDAIDVETATDGKVSISDRSRNSILTLNDNNTLSLDVFGIQNAGYISYTPNGDRVVTYADNHLALLIENTKPVDLLVLSLVSPSTVFGGIMVDDSGLIHVSTSAENSVLRMNNFGSEPEIVTGDIVFQSTVNLNQLQREAVSPIINFGTWTPMVSGEYQVEITSDGSTTLGNLFNTIHVGAKTEGVLALDKTILGAGDQSLGATLTLSGVDTTKFTKIDPSSITLDAATGATGGRAVIADTLGNVYALDSTRIVKVTPDGVVSDFVSFSTYVGYGQMLAIDSNNTIYLADRYHKIYTITLDGTMSELTTLNSYANGSQTSAIAMSYDDKLYALVYSGLLLEIDTSTGAVTKLPVEGLARSKALSIDTFGNFYIINQMNLPEIPIDTIVQVTPEGVTKEIYAGVYFEYEGQTMTVDCANNVLFAPFAFELPSIFEEYLIYQLIGDTGEVSQIFNGGLSGLNGLRDMDVLYYDRFGQRLLIYSDYSNGKVYSLPTVCGGISVNAHVITRNDVDLSSADPAPSSIVDNADGTKEYIWSLDDVDNQGIDIQLNLLFTSLQEGEVRNAFNRAYLEFTNTFNPDKPVTVDINVPDIVVSSQLAVNTIVDATEYLPDSLVNISSQISNESNTSFDGVLKIEIVDAQGVLVESLDDVLIENVTSSNAVTYNSVWNTGNKLAGDYTVLSSLVDAAGLTIANSEQTFRITSGAEGVAFITSSLSSSKPLYSAWDHVVINGRVRNSSTNVIQGESVASVTVTNPEGGIVHTETVSLKTLTPGSHDDVAVYFDLVDVTGGPYNVVMVSHDAASGAELTRNEISFTVERIINQGIVGNISTALSQLELGAANTCTETVTNISASAVSNLTVKHLFVNASTSEVLSTQSQTLALSANETQSFDQTVAVTDGEPGLYACVLQVTAEGVTTTLATTAFEYTEDPIDIDISLQTVTQGRVLVLLDSQTQYDEDGNAFQSDADPHGPIDASLLSVQRIYISQLLESMGWSYTLVEDADSFTQELRSGGYTSYALFSEQIKLPNQVQEELREAVYRGEGLIVAGNHDMRYNKLIDALGIKIHGKDSKVGGFALLSSTVHSGGASSFAFEGTPLRISSQGSEVIGTYTGIDDTTFDEASNASVTRFTYGEGTSIFVGFDLLAQAAKAPLGQLPLFTELLINALSHVDTTGSAQNKGSVRAIELSLTNLGSATPGKVDINLPVDSFVLDAQPSVQIIDNVIHWPFNLDEEEQAKLIFWLQLPSVAGAVIDAQVFTGIEPNWELFDGQQLSLLIAPTENLASLVTLIADLNNQDKAYKQASRLMANAQSAYQASDYSTALTEAVRAASELASIDTTESQSARLALARVIRHIALQQ